MNSSSIFINTHQTMIMAETVAQAHGHQASVLQNDVPGIHGAAGDPNDVLSP